MEHQYQGGGWFYLTDDMGESFIWLRVWVLRFQESFLLMSPPHYFPLSFTYVSLPRHPPPHAIRRQVPPSLRHWPLEPSFLT